MDIEFSQSAAKFLQSADRPTRNRVKAGILGLIQQPPIGDIKVLQGWKPSSYRLRIGKYRIVYSYLQREAVPPISISRTLAHAAEFTNKEGDCHDRAGTGNFDDV